MTIKELEAILKYCGTDKECWVKVEVHFPDGTRGCYSIESFMTFSDGIKFDINTMQ